MQSEQQPLGLCVRVMIAGEPGRGETRWDDPGLDRKRYKVVTVIKVATNLDRLGLLRDGYIKSGFIGVGNESLADNLVKTVKACLQKGETTLEQLYNLVVTDDDLLPVP